MKGIVNVYKEAGYTSFDVVAKLRRILHIKKIGHTGTLDPDAVGVLPVCIGKATKVCELLTDKTKTYQAVVKLGVVTDTLDMTGNVLQTNQVDSQVLTRALLEKTCASFVGEIKQIPPMYSAIKVNGKRLYELAREGKSVERKERTVNIYSISLLDYDDINAEFSIEVSCSKGTYIRTLCDDIGKKLSVGAAMKKLVRTKVGIFSIENALTIDEIEKLVDEEKIDSVLVSIDEIFDAYSKINVFSYGEKLLKNGNEIPIKYCAIEEAIEDCKKYRMYLNGEFAAIYFFDKKKNMLCPVKMFL